jgi:hypothetical protein
VNKVLELNFSIYDIFRIILHIQTPKKPINHLQWKVKFQYF